MGPININTDGIWYAAQVGLAVMAILAFTFVVSAAYVFYRGIMAIIL